jgi:hypothetical protein
MYTPELHQEAKDLYAIYYTKDDLPRQSATMVAANNDRLQKLGISVFGDKNNTCYYCSQSAHRNLAKIYHLLNKEHELRREPEQVQQPEGDSEPKRLRTRTPKIDSNGNGGVEVENSQVAND